MPDETPPPAPVSKKYTRQITLEITSDDEEALDEIAGDMKAAIMVMPEAIALPPGIELSGFYVTDPATGEEIVYDEDEGGDEDDGDDEPDTPANP